MTTDREALVERLKSLKVLLGTDSPEVRGWAPAVQQEAQKIVNATIAALTAQPADDVEDARRYRWLAGDVPQHSTRWQRWKLEHWHGFHGGWQPLTGSELDEAIDAAMETENAK